MDLNGQLILACLQEDDTRRVLFRVRPLLTEHGVFPLEELEKLKNDGCLRVAPGWPEQHTFKERMRSLGDLCLINLAGTDAAPGKIRLNKNYAPERGESNRYIVYSDVVTALPEDLLYEVVCEDKRESALTGQYYLRTGGRISGPYCKSDSLPCSASHTLMPDNERLFLVEMPDKTSRMFYWPRTEAPAEEKDDRSVPRPEPQTRGAAGDPAADTKAVENGASAPGKPSFEAAAEALRRALCASGFMLDPPACGLALALLVCSDKVQIAGDCQADARLAKKTIKSLLPEGLCPKLICSGPDILIKQEKYRKKPWPVLHLASGERVPESRAFDALDEKGLCSAIGRVSAGQDEGLKLFDRLFSRAKEGGHTLPLCFRRDLLDYLNKAVLVSGLPEESILAFACAAFVEPWLLRQNSLSDHAKP